MSHSLPPLSLAAANTNSLSARLPLKRRESSSPRHARLTHIEPTPQTSPDFDEELEQTLDTQQLAEQDQDQDQQDLEEEQDDKVPAFFRAKTAFSIFTRSRHEKNKKGRSHSTTSPSSNHEDEHDEAHDQTRSKRASTVTTTSTTSTKSSSSSSMFGTRFKRAHTLQHLAQFMKFAASSSDHHSNNNSNSNSNEQTVSEDHSHLYKGNTAIQELEAFVMEGNVQGIKAVCSGYEYQRYPTFFMDYSNEQGQTLLMRAAFLGHFTVLKYLINRFKKYKSAIFEATEPTMGRDVACLLLEYMGDYVNYESMGGKSALIFACSCKHKSRLNTVKYLLDSGASVSSPKHSKHGKSPLIHAVEWKQEQLIELLLDYGADVNVQDSNNGFTPLMYAAKFNNRDLCEFLLERGADVTLRNKHGKTAVELAKMDQCWASLLALDVTQIPANILSLAATSPSKNRWGRYSASYSYF